jgi:hypothetical protein
MRRNLVSFPSKLQVLRGITVPLDSGISKSKKHCQSSKHTTLSKNSYTEHTPPHLNARVFVLCVVFVLSLVVSFVSFWKSDSGLFNTQLIAKKFAWQKGGVEIFSCRMHIFILFASAYFSCLQYMSKTFPARQQVHNSATREHLFGSSH